MEMYLDTLVKWLDPKFKVVDQMKSATLVQLMWRFMEAEQCDGPRVAFIPAQAVTPMGAGVSNLTRSGPKS